MYTTKNFEPSKEKYHEFIKVQIVTFYISHILIYRERYLLLGKIFSTSV